MPAPSSPRLQVFPAEDVAFRRWVQDAFEALRAEAAERPRPAMDPGELQWRIRERYPSAVVRRRNPLADPSAEDVLWYVYRFGSVSPGRRWWDEPGHSWAILDDERRLVDVAASLADLVELPREALVGRQLEALAAADAVTFPADIRALWASLLRHGELRSTLRIRLRDGAQRDLEYHVSWDGAGSSRHLVVVREIEVR